MTYLAINLITLSLFAALLAQALNITLGLGKLLNLAHVATASIGAYIVGIGAARLHLPFWTLLPAAAGGAAIMSLLVSAIASRLRNDYFAVGSLAVASLIFSLQTNWRSLTGGALGVTGIPRPIVGGHELVSPSDFLLFVIAVAGTSLVALRLIWNGPFSRSLRAVAEDDTAASALGISELTARRWTFLLASIISGLSGGLYTYHIGFLDPWAFGLPQMMLALTIVVAGRPGSFLGTMTSAVLFMIVPDLLRMLDLPSTILGAVQQLLYATILMVFVSLNRHILFIRAREV